MFNTKFKANVYRNILYITEIYIYTSLQIKLESAKQETHIIVFEVFVKEMPKKFKNINIFPKFSWYIDLVVLTISTVSVFL